MTINRRRAPSSKISREKKLDGHTRESEYAALIGGSTISGTGKGDVRGKNDLLHSVKSGKKWQVFLYGSARITNCKYLCELKSCLDAFVPDALKYFEDRIKCIEFKEAYLKKHGKEMAKQLSNAEVADSLGHNEYIKSKDRLALATRDVCRKLQQNIFLRNFLGEAIFNNTEVSFLAVKDGNCFRVFSQSDVLAILSSNLFPANSRAGLVPVDYNVDGQKVLLRYIKDSKEKNIVEIEIRNDSDTHYRQVRFNMYSKDVLYLLLNELRSTSEEFCKGVHLYGEAVGMFSR